MLQSQVYKTYTPASFHENLRTRTSDAHSNLENVALSRAIVSDQLTLPEYSAYLNAMLAVCLQVEEEIFPRLSDHFSNLGKRSKSHLILSDLAEISYPVAGSSKPFGLTEELNPAQLAGIMYVVEGSILGGRYILRNIKCTLDLDEENGATYFNGYGAQTSAKWKDFISNLLIFEQMNNCGDDIIGGANFAFEAIEKHMTEYVQP